MSFDFSFLEDSQPKKPEQNQVQVPENPWAATFTSSINQPTPTFAALNPYQQPPQPVPPPAQTFEFIDMTAPQSLPKPNLREMFGSPDPPAQNQEIPQQPRDLFGGDHNMINQFPIGTSPNQDFSINQHSLPNESFHFEQQINTQNANANQQVLNDFNSTNLNNPEKIVPPQPFYDNAIPNYQNPNEPQFVFHAPPIESNSSISASDAFTEYNPFGNVQNAPQDPVSLKTMSDQPAINNNTQFVFQSPPPNHPSNTNNQQHNAFSNYDPFGNKSNTPSAKIDTTIPTFSTLPPAPSPALGAQQEVQVDNNFANTDPFAPKTSEASFNAFGQETSLSTTVPTKEPSIFSGNNQNNISQSQTNIFAISGNSNAQTQPNTQFQNPVPSFQINNKMNDKNNNNDPFVDLTIAPTVQQEPKVDTSVPTFTSNPGINPPQQPSNNQSSNAFSKYDPFGDFTPDINEEKKESSNSNSKPSESTQQQPEMTTNSSAPSSQPLTDIKQLRNLFTPTLPKVEKNEEEHVFEGDLPEVNVTPTISVSAVDVSNEEPMEIEFNDTSMYTDVPEVDDNDTSLDYLSSSHYPNSQPQPQIEEPKAKSLHSIIDLFDFTSTPNPTPSVPAMDSELTDFNYIPPPVHNVSSAPIFDSIIMESPLSQPAPTYNEAPVEQSNPTSEIYDPFNKEKKSRLQGADEVADIFSSSSMNEDDSTPTEQSTGFVFSNSPIATNIEGLPEEPPDSNDHFNPFGSDAPAIFNDMNEIPSGGFTFDPNESSPKETHVEENKPKNNLNSTASENYDPFGNKSENSNSTAPSPSGFLFEPPKQPVRKFKPVPNDPFGRKEDEPEPPKPVIIDPFDNKIKNNKPAEVYDPFGKNKQIPQVNNSPAVNNQQEQVHDPFKNKTESKEESKTKKKIIKKEPEPSPLVAEQPQAAEFVFSEAPNVTTEVQPVFDPFSNTNNSGNVDFNPFEKPPPPTPVVAYTPPPEPIRRLPSDIFEIKDETEDNSEEEEKQEPKSEIDILFESTLLPPEKLGTKTFKKISTPPVFTPFAKTFAAQILADYCVKKFGVEPNYILKKKAALNSANTEHLNIVLGGISNVSSSDFFSVED